MCIIVFHRRTLVHSNCVGVAPGGQGAPCPPHFLVLRVGVVRYLALFSIDIAMALVYLGYSFEYGRRCCASANAYVHRGMPIMHMYMDHMQ